MIIDVPPGVYDIEASCIGYRTEVKKGVIVKTGHPLELKFYLKEAPIITKPIVSVAKQPDLTKEMVGTTIVIRPDELLFSPETYPLEKIMIQPAVSYTGTTFHVRGGRANEVLYLVDNIPILDRQNGELGLYFHQGMVEEAIFFPGTFGVEYGGALSGVINLISPVITDFSFKSRTLSEKPLTDFGFFNFQSTVIFKPAIITADLTTTDDWDPRLFLQRHKQRQDYCIYGKTRIPVRKDLKISLTGLRSRTQFDRYHPDWRYHIKHYRSDLRRGNMFSSNFAFLPKSNMSLNLALSHFNTENEFGVRDEGSLNPLQDIRFDDFSEYTRPIKGFNNPTGWPDFFVTEGEYPEYAWSNSDQWFGRFTSKVQFNPSHQVYLGLSGTRFSIEKFHVIYPYHVVPIIDDYAFQPGEYSFFIEDGIEHQDLFVKAGLRFDRYDYDTGTTYNIFSPRVGFSFMIKEDLLMRANIGRYVQPPLFDQLYTFQGYETRTLPDDNPILVGNPHLEPERTIATEIGFQGQLSEGINATTTFFYKDVTNLIGTRLIRAVPVDYSTFMNVEFANVKGIEFVLSLYQPLIEGHLSYTLSYARGTSSYATEGYSEYIIEDPDTILNFPKIDYPLDFDQRHRIFIRTTFHLPYQIDLFSYLYLGSGFPYTPPGGKGDPATMNTIQSPFRKDLGISITRTFDLGKGNVALSFEILNALDFRDVKYVYPATGLPNDNGVRVERNDFAGGWSLFNKGYYHPSQDLNNDGYVSGRESYLSYVTANFYSMDWPNNYGPSRRYRIGLKIVF